VATAPPISGPKTILHTRGTWSARGDRAPSAVWLAILWVGMFAGFGTDFPKYLHQSPPPSMVLHVHAAVFSVWMLLLTTQILLVLGNRVAIHRRLGVFAVGWACLMAIMGPWAAIDMQAARLHGPHSNPWFLALNIADISGFLILLAWGISLRKNPAAHRRMMILSTVSLADPGFARLALSVHPIPPHSVLPWFFFMFYGNILLIALMAAWDWWRGRLMRSFVFGAAGLLAAEFVAALLNFWPPWRALTLSWVQLWAKHFV
jgi:hypothetical protein